MNWKTYYTELKIGDIVKVIKPCTSCGYGKDNQESRDHCFHTSLTDGKRKLKIKLMNGKLVKVVEPNGDGFCSFVPKECLKKVFE